MGAPGKRCARVVRLRIAQLIARYSIQVLRNGANSRASFARDEDPFEARRHVRRLRCVAVRRDPGSERPTRARWTGGHLDVARFAALQNRVFDEQSTVHLTAALDAQRFGTQYLQRRGWLRDASGRELAAAQCGCPNENTDRNKRARSHEPMIAA